MTELAKDGCEPCRKGAPQVTDEEAEALHREVPAWNILERAGEKRLERVFTFPDFAGAQFLGKALLLMVLKVVTLGVLAVAGFAAWWGVRMLGGSMAAAIGAAAGVMFIPCIPLTWLVGRTFARFDLTRDAPAP